MRSSGLLDSSCQESPLKDILWMFKNIYILGMGHWEWGMGLGYWGMGIGEWGIGHGAWGIGHGALG
jgi:hypothetical protein